MYAYDYMRIRMYENANMEMSKYIYILNRIHVVVVFNNNMYWLFKLDVHVDV